ncbi:MAG: baseplate J/gp47 family protein [Bacillota bacterium]|nr:baseplate J/gp47 family protein [Bacillota bacterium]
MYSENNSENIILERMKSSVANDVDKSEGSFIHDALSPAANEFAQFYIKLDEVASKFNIENLQGDELSERIYQRTGITRNPATYAYTELTVTGTGNINIDDLFEISDEIQFKAVESKTINGSDTVKVQCVQPGSIGMVPANQITKLPIVITGISSVTNLEPTQDGFDEEDDSSLIERYYERVSAPATQGNIAQYISLAKNCPGIGDVKVYPTWNGNNTVKLIVIDANKQPPSDELVNELQNYMDPAPQGLGNGAAPFGAVTTVQGAAAKQINVSFTAVRDPGYSDTQRLQNFQDTLTEYLQSIAFKENYVSYSKIGSIIFSTPGFKDYSNLTVNGDTSNIILNYTSSLTETPVKGVVNIVY